MAIPGYQEFMLPLLRLAQDKLEHTMSDATEVLAKVMGISEADQELRIASGTQTRFYNRVAWAVTYLTKSGLLEKPARGRFRIAPRGVEVLKENPTRIDNAFLARFPEYNAFKAKKVDPEPAKQVDGGEVIELAEDTPDEQMDRAFEELREALADEILTRVRSVSPKAFEHLVVDLLRAMGYGLPEADAAKVVGRSGDGGVDGVILEDRLGLDMVYVQAKRYTSDVGPAPIREFVGSLGEHRANKGVFITSSGFTSGARDAAAKAHTRIVLIDGEQLARFMIDHGVGASIHKNYVVKRLDSDYFSEL